MSDQNIGQILKAFNSIESKIEAQNTTLKELHLKVKTLESQNKQLAQMINKLEKPSAPQTDYEQLAQNKQFQTNVTKSLSSIEDKSKKTMELIKANSGKKRAWP